MLLILHICVNHNPKKIMNLREYLFRKKIKHEDFAKQIEVSRKTLYSIMNGRMDPRLSVVRRIEKMTHGEVLAQDIQIKEPFAASV